MRHLKYIVTGILVFIQGVVQAREVSTYLDITDAELNAIVAMNFAVQSLSLESPDGMYAVGVTVGNPVLTTNESAEQIALTISLEWDLFADPATGYSATAEWIEDEFFNDDPDLTTLSIPFDVPSVDLNIGQIAIQLENVMTQVQGLYEVALELAPVVDEQLGIDITPYLDYIKTNLIDEYNTFTLTFDLNDVSGELTEMLPENMSLELSDPVVTPIILDDGIRIQSTVTAVGSHPSVEAQIRKNGNNWEVRLRPSITTEVIKSDGGMYTPWGYVAADLIGPVTKDQWTIFDIGGDTNNDIAIYIDVHLSGFGGWFSRKYGMLVIGISSEWINLPQVSEVN